MKTRVSYKRLQVDILDSLLFFTLLFIKLEDYDRLITSSRAVFLVIFSRTNSLIGLLSSTGSIDLTIECLEARRLLISDLGCRGLSPLAGFLCLNSFLKVEGLGEEF